MTPEWVKSAKSTPIATIAHQLGMRGVRRHYPCPARCGDGEPVYATSGGWRCMRCEARSDAVDFVSYAMHGRRFRDLTGAERDGVRAWFGGSSTWTSPPPEPVIPPPAPSDLHSFWRSLRPVFGGAEAYLQGRGLDTRRIRGLDLARMPGPLEDRPWWPKWWGGTWRVIVRGYNAEGDVVNMHARAIKPPGFRKDGSPWPKTRWGLGLSASGCLMWNRVRPKDACVVLVAEGITDWLTLASFPWRSPVAVYGAASGGFGALGQALAKTSAPVVSAVDPDAAGDAYHGRMEEAVARRVLRVDLPRGVDVNDYARGGWDLRALVGRALAT